MLTEAADLMLVALAKPLERLCVLAPHSECMSHAAPPRSVNREPVALHECPVSHGKSINVLDGLHMARFRDDGKVARIGEINLSCLTFRSRCLSILEDSIGNSGSTEYALRSARHITT